MTLTRLLLLACSVAVLSNTAAALPIDGEMNLAGFLTARSPSLDFGDGAAAGTGAFVTVQGGTGYFSSIASTSLATPYLGAVKDLTPTSSDVSEFLGGFTAPGYAGLTVTLNQIVSPTAPPCTGSEASNTSCSLGYLTLTNLGGNNTALAILVSGTAQDSSVPDSQAPILGRYTSQTGRSISEVMTSFADSGVTASYSANFNAAPGQAPEPHLLLMLGVGLAATGLLRRKAAADKR